MTISSFAEIRARLISKVYNPLVEDLLLWNLLEKRSVGFEVLFPVRLEDQRTSRLPESLNGRDPDDAGQVIADNVFDRLPRFPFGDEDLIFEMRVFSQDHSRGRAERIAVMAVLNALDNLDSARSQKEIKLPPMFGVAIPKIWAFPKKLALMTLYQELQKLVTPE